MDSRTLVAWSKAKPALAPSLGSLNKMAPTCDASCWRPCSLASKSISLVWRLSSSELVGDTRLGVKRSCMGCTCMGGAARSSMWSLQIVRVGPSIYLQAYGPSASLLGETSWPFLPHIPNIEVATSMNWNLIKWKKEIYIYIYIYIKPTRESERWHDSRSMSSASASASVMSVGMAPWGHASVCIYIYIWKLMGSVF